MQNPNVFEKTIFLPDYKIIFCSHLFPNQNTINQNEYLLEICKGEELFIDLVLLGTESHLKQL